MRPTPKLLLKENSHLLLNGLFAPIEDTSQVMKIKVLPVSVPGQKRVWLNNTEFWLVLEDSAKPLAVGGVSAPFIAQGSTDISPPGLILTILYLVPKNAVSLIE